MSNNHSDIHIDTIGIKLPLPDGRTLLQYGNDVVLCKAGVCENFICSSRVVFQNGELKCEDKVLLSYKTSKW